MEGASQNDNVGHAQQLGVFELHAGAYLWAVVEKYFDTGVGKFGGETFSGFACGFVLVGNDDVDCEGSDFDGPVQALVVVALFCKDADEA